MQPTGMRPTTASRRPNDAATAAAHRHHQDEVDADEHPLHRLLCVRAQPVIPRLVRQPGAAQPLSATSMRASPSTQTMRATVYLAHHARYDFLHPRSSLFHWIPLSVEPLPHRAGPFTHCLSSSPSASRSIRVTAVRRADVVEVYFAALREALDDRYRKGSARPIREALPVHHRFDVAPFHAMDAAIPGHHPAG